MKTITATFLLAGLLSGQTSVPQGSAADSRAAIEAKLLVGRDDIKAALGADPGENIVVVEITFTPKTQGKMYLDHDDFLLRTDNDGQRSTPMYPTQIAGSAVLVISSKGGNQGAVTGERRRVPYGVPGIPGTPGSPPPSMPGTDPPLIGSTTADTSDARASLEEKKQDEEQKALLKALTDKRLPDGEITGPVSGLLYFSLDGKHKTKHFEFVYRKSPPRLSLRFTEPKKK